MPGDRLRILKISDVFFPRINGVSTSIRTFADSLREAGHEVTLIAPEYGVRYEHAGKSTTCPTTEANLIRVPSGRILFDPEDRLMRRRRVYRLLPGLRAANYDIVHIHTPFQAHYAGVKIARKLGIPVIESYHTFFEEYFYNYIPWVPKSLLKFAARRFSSSQCNSVNGLVVPSTPMLEVLRDYGVKAEARVLPTGLDLNTLKNGDGARFRAEYGIAADRPTLVHVGRIAHEKNISFLFDVLERVVEQLPEVLMIVAGEGPALDSLKKRVARNGMTDNVLFIGYLDRATTLLDCYRAGDAFVFASRTETQGLVLLEAMALGVPVVSTAVMGTKDILKPKLGALVVDEDREEFASAVLRLLGDMELRLRLSEEAVSYAAQWRQEAMTEQLLDFYRESIDRYSCG